MLQPGDLIDIWVVDKALGSGGMGSVYRCHNRAANRILGAIKVLDTGLRRHPEAEARFIREAEILFQLDHPNIVKVRNVRTDVDPPYLEMEFVEGESLEARLQRGPRTLDESLTLMAQCASALRYMHEKGVRHRDIKPANLLIQPDGVLKLVDFGLAMEANATRITQQGMAFGTVSYAPPEWIAPDSMDPTLWDMYALGVVFYEMLTGELAFPVSGQGSARQQAMQVIVGKQDHPPLDPGEHFHQDLRALIADMTRAKASERVPEMAEVVRRIRGLMRAPLKHAGVTLMPGDLQTEQPAAPRQLPPKATPILPPVTKSKTRSTSSRSGRWVAAGLLAAGMAVGGLGLVALATYDDGQRELRLIVSGTPPHDVRVNGAPPKAVSGNVQTYDRFEEGAQLQVQWALGGTECTVARCFGSGCRSFCLFGEQALTIEPGSGVQAHELALDEPSVLSVFLPLPAIQGDWAVSAVLGETVGTPVEGGVQFVDVLPGRHPLSLRVGTCPDDAASCWPGGICPDGCVAHDMEAEVSIGATELREVRIPPPDAAVEQPAPAPESAPTPSSVESPAPQPDPPEPAPVASGSVAGSRVTVGQFAGWLADNADWQRQGPFAPDELLYLANWEGATPPAGRDGRPVSGVTFTAARAFCKARGTDLATFDDRTSDGKLGIRDSELEYRLNPLSPDWPAMLGWSEGDQGEEIENSPLFVSTAFFRCAGR
ncbi:MAG: serine/threonine protein kinase [Myxococcales bacterium]|nr:serine/threonine protein kinase [Myxococcales bacterium]